MELTSLTISQAAKRLSSGELSPVELTQALLDRIARLDSVTEPPGMIGIEALQSGGGDGRVCFGLER